MQIGIGWRLTGLLLVAVLATGVFFENGWWTLGAIVAIGAWFVAMMESGPRE